MQPHKTHTKRLAHNAKYYIYKINKIKNKTYILWTGSGLLWVSH